MNLRTIDLNLLLVFDTVYAERSISKAADKLNLSQPTVSNALARLRDRLSDPLFTRSASGMMPTARAKALAGPIRQALDLMELGIRGDNEFDPAASSRNFVIAVEDYGEAVILPPFVDWLARVAPNLTLRILPGQGGTLADELRDGNIDLCIDYFVQRAPKFHNECVMTERLVTLARPDHPQLRDDLSLEDYLALRHVVLTPRPGATPMIDLALSKRGLRRHVAVEVPHFLSMPLLVQASEMVCTLPHRMALLYADHFRLRSHALPLKLPMFPVYLTWHSLVDDDPAHSWLRTHLIEHCRRL
jgi:DNA-binding transcriptional LysR family regulator